MASTLHPAIVSVGRALPPNHVDRDTLIAALSAHWGKQHFNVDRLGDVHRAAQVGGRHLALPLAEYAGLDSFGKCNDAPPAPESGPSAKTGEKRLLPFVPNYVLGEFSAWYIVIGVLIGILFLKESFGRIRLVSALFIMAGAVLIRHG